MADKIQRWITITDAMTYFDKSDRTIRRWIKTGQISSKKDKGRVFVMVYDTGSDTDSDTKTKTPGQAAAMTALNVEIARLKELLSETRNDRDYLRQALAGLMVTQQKLIEAQTSEQKQERRWWQFGK